MAVENLLQKLWDDYSAMNQQAEVIHRALSRRGEKVINDHVAFRTFDHPPIGIDKMAAPFLEQGYQEKDRYEFTDKKLIAKYFQHPDPGLPKIFISALQLQKFSGNLPKILDDLIRQIPENLTRNEDFLISGTPWKKIPWKTYQELLQESEYAAWMAAFGFRVNHFTVFFNALKSFKELSELNAFIKSLGYPLNNVGGEVKGSPRVYLEQSSTLAYPVEVIFQDRKEIIPACYYEFARRYPMPDGLFFQGFIPDSANKIFESTNFRPPS